MKYCLLIFSYLQMNFSNLWLHTFSDFLNFSTPGGKKAYVHAYLLPLVLDMSFIFDYYYDSFIFVSKDVIMVYHCDPVLNKGGKFVLT